MFIVIKVHMCSTTAAWMPGIFIFIVYHVYMSYKISVSVQVTTVQKTSLAYLCS